ncbi:D-alanyl-D-alanine carboxypeptidase family protein [Marininema halotolerans]|uniref:serine-type D-Ala-D-Ala carboxypeptidase n=1 Tax=Marininema halotolerans TaxID=1155944 RepID=A0A1I6PBW1_9BACL|nr:D-alanyl-D-alanine carboxypeptidase family protein [Marininema halotolerans]SFS37663.1 D-alanyl-D-alanine carboxypeptidase (penicillin-binding protein 5/6) [Marininema halotolerans]
MIRRNNKVMLLLLSLLIGGIGWIAQVETAQAASSAIPIDVKARSYILLDKNSGRVLVEKGASKRYAPASLTKIMTEYIVLDRIKQGKLSWDDIVRVSKNAERIDEAQVYLKAGEKRSIRELFTAMAVYSANDAAVALAEHVAGSETKFVALMNQQAKKLGLTSSHFTNCTGLPKRSYPDYPDVQGKHVMSAGDVARLTRQILLDHEEVLPIVSHSRYVFRQGETGERMLLNWNRMLPGFAYAYKGLDGFKTGYTREAGYNFAGSAKQKGFRLVSVVMGTRSKSARFVETKKLLDYGFSRYQQVEMIHRHQVVTNHPNAPIKDGESLSVPAISKEKLTLPIIPEEKRKYRIQVTFREKLQAPINKGTVVGKAKILYDGKGIPAVKSIDLIAGKSVEKASWWRLLFRSLFGED